MKRITALLSLGLLLLACDPPEVEVAVSSVSLNKSSAELTVGETVKLTATVLPADAKDKTVSWSSSNTSVATVSPTGDVTAVAEGSSTIKATAGSKSATCAVTVVKPNVTVSSVTLDKDRLDLTVGGTAKLTATVSPADASDKNVTWESSDAAVATVDKDGNVKALKGGTSTVTAKAGGKSASALVDVMEVTPSSIGIEAAGGDIKVTVVTTRKYHLDSKPDWITEVSVDKQVHTFKVAANTDTSERSGVIVICDEAGTCLSCQVKQAGADPVFSITPDKVDLEAKGGTFTVTVTANHPYHLSSTPDWVTEKSFKDNVYTFEVGANEEISERSGVVVICDDAGTCLPCTVKQAGAAPVFSISPEKVEMAAEGGTFDLTVTANIPYHVSSTPDWVTQKSQKDNVYTFEVAANMKPADRSGVIVICDDTGTCLPCSVKQAGAEVYLTVEPEKVEFELAGGTADIAVSSNDKWTVSSSASWCEVTPASGEGDGSFTVKAGEFRSEGTRSATVTVKGSSGSSSTVTVEQYGIVPFAVTPLTVDLGEEGGTFEIKVTSSYGYHISGMSEWISQTSVSGKVHSFKAEANPEFAMRKGVVTFCDDEGTCLSVEVRQAKHVAGPGEVDWSKEFYHRSLSMLFTSVLDGYGPVYERAIKAAQSKKPGKVEKLVLHFMGDVYYDDLYFEPSNTLMSQYGISDRDLVMDGRHVLKSVPWVTSSIEDIRDEIVTSVENLESAFPTVSAIGWESSISGNRLTVTPYIFVKEAGDYKYTVFLVEDGVICYQSDHYVSTDTYIHDGITRVAVTSVSGEAFKAYSAKTVKSKKFTVTIPDKCVKENLRILVYVQRAYGKMQKISPSDYDGYFIDNCSSGKAGENMLPKVVTGTSGGNEDATEGNPINW